jgi:hypothetical protein
MDAQANQRRSRRHAARWNVALVMDNPDGEPIILHTHSIDLSLGGMAVFSERQANSDILVSVVMVQPPRNKGEEASVVEARARIVSAAESPPGFRLGLNFIEWNDDSLGTFAKLLGAIETESRRATPPVAVPPRPGGEDASQTTTGSRIARLKAMAQARMAEQSATSPRERTAERVSEALGRAYDYLKEFVEQLNVLKPAFDGYRILGVSDFSGLAWQAGRTDYRRRDISPTKWLYERVNVSYRLSAGKQVNVALDATRAPRLKQVLGENKVQFTAQESRNERGALERVTFQFPCEVTASVMLSGDFEAGCILLRMINVGHFGVLEHTLDPAAVNEEGLEEFVGFVLGESHRFDRLLRKGQ